MQIDVIRSSRKTIAIQINSDGNVTVRAPKRATNRDIERVLREKATWIDQNIEKMRKIREQVENDEKLCLSPERIRKLTQEAYQYIPERVKHFSELIGVDYGRITVRKQKTRWGSCSRKGNLNFNCLLMLAPASIIDYVVIHELCHRKEMNHSQRFWNEIQKVCPEYREYEKWLKREGRVIIEANNIKNIDEQAKKN